MSPESAVSHLRYFVASASVNEKALADRRRIIDERAAGRVPTGPRVDFTTRMVHKIMAVIFLAAQEYEAEHEGQDCITGFDVLDILLSVIETVKSGSE